LEGARNLKLLLYIFKPCQVWRLILRKVKSWWFLRMMIDYKNILIYSIARKGSSPSNIWGPLCVPEY
jgi:hypothetical protein